MVILPDPEDPKGRNFWPILVVIIVAALGAVSILLADQKGAKEDTGSSSAIDAYAVGK